MVAHSLRCWCVLRLEFEAFTRSLTQRACDHITFLTFHLAQGHVCLLHHHSNFLSDYSSAHNPNNDFILGVNKLFHFLDSIQAPKLEACQFPYTNLKDKSNHNESISCVDLAKCHFVYLVDKFHFRKTYVSLAPVR